MVLVVGATGLLGGEVCRRLATSGTSVRALVRPTSDPAKVMALRDLGVQVVQGDLRDWASAADACLGVTSVITTVSAMPMAYEPNVNDIETTDRQGMLHLVDAAQAAGVQHFVYTSFSANIDRSFPLRNAKREVERHIVDSGMAYTILRPSCFMELWLSPIVGFDPTNGTAMVFGSGDAPVSYISIGDVAAFAVAALTAPGARNAILELGGPRAVPPLEVVRLFEDAMSRPIEVAHIPAVALDAQLAAATDPMQQSFLGIQRCVADGDPIDMSRTVGLIPEPLTSVEAFAARCVPAAAAV
jgi:uncharacterized protein YbjT (DUF2867 family)